MRFWKKRLKRTKMKTRVLIKEGEYRLSKAGCMDARIDAEELYCFLTGSDKVNVFLKADEEVDSVTEEKYFDLIARRATREPLQHITGEQEFMGFKFKVTPDVLVPRQDTETLVTEAAKIIKETPRDELSLMQKLKGDKQWDVLDLCCGSGIIGISMAKICDNVSVVASDISSAAVDVAQENARALRTKIKFFCGDMFEPLTGYTFDMIVSNPPYIRTNMIAMLQEEVKSFDPMEALDGGRDGLDYYRVIVEKAPKFLKKDGYLLMEIGSDQAEELRKLIMESGAFTKAEVIRDLAGRERVIKCRLK